MKPDRRTLLIGAAVIAVVVLLNARPGQRAACAGGSCCSLLPMLSLLSSNGWPVIESTNAALGATPGASFTNRQQ